MPECCEIVWKGNKVAVEGIRLYGALIGHCEDWFFL